MKESEIEVLVKEKDNSRVKNHIHRKIDLLEEYEYDMYFSDWNDNKQKNVFEEGKSIYQIIKDEAIIWLITGTVVGGAYVINNLIEKYFIK
jgi:hypothetical protein